MNTTLKIRKGDAIESNPVEEFTVNGKQFSAMAYRAFGLLLLLSVLLQYFIVSKDPSEGFIGPNIWLMALMALTLFMTIVALCWWLLQKFWMSLGLPGLGNMVLQFRQLTLWQQLGFYWASFGLLLLAGVGALVAVL
jgi:hypothetical protein